jgi:hypothetical protein
MLIELVSEYLYAVKYLRTANLQIAPCNLGLGAHLIMAL